MKKQTISKNVHKLSDKQMQCENVLIKKNAGNQLKIIKKSDEA